jgi:hypothetical protein
VLEMKRVLENRLNVEGGLVILSDSEGSAVVFNGANGKTDPSLRSG